MKTPETPKVPVTTEQLYRDSWKVVKLAQPKTLVQHGTQFVRLEDSPQPSERKVGDGIRISASAGGVKVGFANDMYDKIEAFFKPEATEVEASGGWLGHLYLLNGKVQTDLIFAKGKLKQPMSLPTVNGLSCSH